MDVAEPNLESDTGRFFTTAGIDPADELDWQRRDARIVHHGTGAVVFEQRDVEFPAAWSQNATDIVAQKYFRGAPGTAARERSLRDVVARHAGVSLDRPYRPVRLVFRLLGTGALRLDAGDGLTPVSLSPPGPDGRFTGDAELRAAGWRRGTDEPIWRVEQDDPQPCTILSVTAEIMGNT